MSWKRQRWMFLSPCRHWSSRYGAGLRRPKRTPVAAVGAAAALAAAWGKAAG
jgi:hypothetical protein